MVCSQAAAFNRCVNKVHDEVQNKLGLLFRQLGKGKFSQKIEKALHNLKYLTAFQQNVNFVQGKSIQHMADTLFVQAANMTLMTVAYINKEESMKSGRRLLSWCNLRNIILLDDPRIIEHDCRQTISSQFNYPDRMVFPPGYFRPNLPKLAHTPSRSVCHQVQQEIAMFLSPVPDKEAWAVDALSLSC